MVRQKIYISLLVFDMNLKETNNCDLLLNIYLCHYYKINFLHQFFFNIYINFLSVIYFRDVVNIKILHEFKGHEEMVEAWQLRWKRGLMVLIAKDEMMVL